MLVLTDVSRALGWRSPRPQTFETLPFIESRSRQIDKANDIWRVPSPRDDGATIRMSDHLRGSILSSSQPAGSVDIVGQRSKGILHGENRVTLFMERRN